MTTARHTLRLVQNVADSYPAGSPGRALALGQLAALRAPVKRIVDPSAYLDANADSLAMRAARTADRRPSPRAMGKTRPFGKQARRRVRAARTAFNLALLALLAGTLLTVAVQTAATLNAGVY